MVTFETVMRHLRWDGATHLVINPDGSLIAYRKSIAFPKHWAYTSVAKVGDFYYAGESWLLSDRLHTDAKVIE